MFDRSEQKSYALDFRETASSRATEDMFVNKPNSSLIGGLAIATPGEVAGLYEAWQKFGSLPWASLVKPTEEILRKGFLVPKSLAKAIDDIREDAIKYNMTELMYVQKHI